jgi:Uri superfamily endonuclease
MVPSAPGTYALILHLAVPSEIVVGRLGRFHFLPGWYVYCGSARGLGGLAARLARHVRTTKVHHWHIDYLRAHSRPTEVWYVVDVRKQECEWARVFCDWPDAVVPIPRFGASDCRCVAHLFHYTQAPNLMVFAQTLGCRVLREVVEI